MAKLSDITDDEWGALASRLTLYAVKKMRRLRWKGCRPASGATGPGGVDADDVANMAIERVLDGKRAWDEAANPFDNLCSVVDSVVSHLAEGLPNRRERMMPTAVSADGDVLPIELPGFEPDPAQAFVDAVETEKYRQEVRAAVSKDPLATGIFDCLKDGYSSPADMAVLLDKPVEQIYTAKKRLERAIDSVRKKPSDPNRSVKRRNQCPAYLTRPTRFGMSSTVSSNRGRCRRPARKPTRNFARSG